jgi:polysaccharide export outer membrane protein
MKYASSFFRTVVFGTVCLAGLLLLAGCSSTGDSGSGPGGAASVGARPPGPGPMAKRLSQESNDTLRVGELISIEFSGVSDPPVRHEERIKVDGQITLPSIGSVQAAGISRGQLEEDIHNRYVPNYYRQLTVVVRNEGRFFYVGGQVKNPNQFPYLKEMTILKAIATAGDFTDFAKKSKVQVTRADGRKVQVNCIKAQHDPNLDVPIFPDDNIFVPRRYF